LEQTFSSKMNEDNDSLGEGITSNNNFYGKDSSSDTPF